MVSKPPVVSKAAVRRAHRYVKTLVVAFDWGYQAVLGPDTVTAQARRVADMPLSASPASDEVSRALLSLKRVNQHMAVHGSGQRAIDSYYELAYELGVDPGELDATVHWLKAGRRRTVESPPAPAMSTEQAVAAAIAEMVHIDPDTLQSEVGGLVVTTSDQLEAVIAQRRNAERSVEFAKLGCDRTDTPEFRRWFGDSKVVDSEGRPLVVYHGTTADFTVFDDARHGDNFGHAPEHMQGFYFTPEEWLADSVADNSDLPGTSRTIAAYLSLKNPVEIDAGGRDPGVEWMGKKLADAKKACHDGAIIRNWADGMFPTEDFDGKPLDIPPQYVAFRPEQIKSATANRGTFDNTNPDILFSFADAEELVRNEPGIRFSCRPETGETYAARIDELFVGGKASLAGVRVLDRSDLLDLLGYGNKPVEIGRAHV